MPEKRATKEIKATRAMPVRTAAVRGIFTPQTAAPALHSISRFSCLKIAIPEDLNDADNSRVWMPFAFNRIYNAGSDIVLQYEFIQLTPGTQLNGAVYNITIIALD